MGQGQTAHKQEKQVSKIVSVLVSTLKAMRSCDVREDSSRRAALAGWSGRASPRQCHLSKDLNNEKKPDPWGPQV